MSPAATITPDTGAVGRRIDSLDRRQDSSDFTTCGSVVPSDQSIQGSVIGCLGGFCAVSSPWVDCLTPGRTYRTTCLDEHATCVGFTCPSNAVLCNIYLQTVCQTWYYGSNLTQYVCGTASYSINAIALSLTSFTPITSSISLPGASIETTTVSPTSSPTSSLAIQTTQNTSQQVGSNIPSSTTSSSTGSSPSHTQSSLSTRTWAGIGVGASFGAILTVAILIVIFRKKLHARLKLFPRQTPEISSINRNSELPNPSSSTRQYPVELTAPTEHYVRYELSDPREVAQELPAEVILPRGSKDG
jgi:hypothetical protein